MSGLYDAGVLLTWAHIVLICFFFLLMCGVYTCYNCSASKYIGVEFHIRGFFWA